ncbi:MAG: hypothetical protein KC940_00865 [Candidatus Omnitrophica bacterium]|nr:hypothetical protein [Candidatus Omnitrophota bacterium]
MRHVLGNHTGPDWNPVFSWFLQLLHHVDLMENGEQLPQLFLGARLDVFLEIAGDPIEAGMSVPY